MDFLKEEYTNLISEIQSILEYLFVPNEDYFNDRISELKEKFESKFPIIEQLITLFESFIDNSNGTGDMPAFTFTIYGVTIGILDFSLLEDYLPTVKSIISAFLWIQFLMSLLFKLPNLIQGQTFFEVRSAELDHNFAYLQRRSGGKFRRL